MRRDTQGFTLIELLIVVVIIGILAAIAIPKFSSTREKAFIATMKSDLRNLQSAEELYYGDSYTYSANEGDLDAWSPSDDVTVAITVSGSGDGYSATASHAGTTVTCAVFQGDAAVQAPATDAGEVACTT